MPRSSRHKSHKQHRHSSKDAREQSDSEEDVSFKERNVKDKTLITVSRDSSSEKRKLSQTQDGNKHLLGPGNGDLSGEHGSSRRRKERVEGPVVDRWNGGEVVDKELRGENTELGIDKGSKLDLKSKSSRKHESSSERKSDNNSGLAVEREDARKSGSKVEQKPKSEKDLGLKEGYQYKEVKEKEHRSEREKTNQDGKRERKIDAMPVTVNQKRELENAERRTHDKLQNHESEKDLDKRIRKRRDDSDEKNKYQDDSRDAKYSRPSAKDDNTRNGRYKDEMHKDGKHSDRQHADLRKDHRNRDDKHRDDYFKDYAVYRSDNKHSKEESPLKKSKPHDRVGDESPHIDGRGTYYKEERGKKRSLDDNEDYIDLKPRSIKEQRSVMEKISTNSNKMASHADQSRHAGTDSTASRSRRRTPSPSAHFVKDQSRNSSKEESKFGDSVSEKRVWRDSTPSRDRFNISERASETRSKTKTWQEDDNRVADFSAERSPILSKHASPALLNEKSHSSPSIDRRYLNRTDVRQSLDMEESGRRSSGFRDAKDYSDNNGRRSRDLPMEKSVDEFSQADGDSVSSSFNRNSHFPSSSSVSTQVPSFRTGVASPSIIGPNEEEGRGKSSIRYRRNGDINVGRGQGTPWKGIPNWPSPLPNGFIPFQHGPPPGGFHPMMQQFPAPHLYGIRSPMEFNHPGVPYHFPAAERFSPHMHGWEGNNGVFGDESHVYGRPDWDQNRNVVNGRGWEVNSDPWKGQELPKVPRKDDHMSTSSDDVLVEQKGQLSGNERNQPDFRAESIEVKRSKEIAPPKELIEGLVEHTLEKTAEPSTKPNNNDPHFSHVYLSKLHISEVLTEPELYKSLFNKKGSSIHDDAVNFAYMEGTRPKFSNINSSASLFPTINDAVQQRAMMLYKKRGDVMNRKLPVPCIPESEQDCVQTNGSEEPKVLSASDGRKQEEVPPPGEEMSEEIPGQKVVEEESSPSPMMVQELDPVLMMTEEPVQAEIVVEMAVKARMAVGEPDTAQMICEEPIIVQSMDVELIPASDQNVAEEPIHLASDENKSDQSILARDQNKAEELVPATNEKNADDEVTALKQEKAREAVLTSKEKEEEPFTAFDHEKGETPVLDSDQDKTDDPQPIPDKGREELPITNSLEVKELVMIPDEEKPEEIVVPASYHQEKWEEAAISADKEILEVGAEDQFPPQTTLSELNPNEPTELDAITISSHSEDNIPTVRSDEHNKADPLGSSDEVCEALMPESIECSRSISRRLNSSGSTH